MEVKNMIEDAMENVEVVEMIPKNRSLGGIAIGAGAAAAIVGLGVVAYKKIAKPAIEKRKAAKAAKVESQDFVEESEDQE